MEDVTHFEDGTFGDGTSDNASPVLADADSNTDNLMDSFGDTPKAESDIHADWYPLLSDCQLSVSNIDTNVSVLADYLMQKFGPLEKSLDAVSDTGTEESGLEALLSEAGTESGETAVSGDVDIYAHKLDAIIELQTTLNDNLVKSYSNINQSLFVLVLIVSFLAGSLFVSFLLSKVRV